jgi:3-methyladenine DNA glycosylase/8-oxoguanine DNA glycosylase
MASLVIELDGPLDLRATLRPLLRGDGDPTMRLGPWSAWRACRTPDGPASLRIDQVTTSSARAEAWGPGAEWALEHAPGLLGATDEPAALVPRHPAVARAAHRLPGARIGRSGLVWDALLPAILEQKVTGAEARFAFRSIVRRFGERAPGPVPSGPLEPGRPLLVPPPPETLAALPYHLLHPFGVERRRADTLRRAALEAGRFERLAAGPFTAAEPRLRAVPGIGPWTAAEVGIRAWGDPDAVSVGDFHLPNLVAWALAGEPRGDDARMLELLEPYRGQRGRVVRLLELSGSRPPAFGPRLAPRRIAAI